MVSLERSGRLEWMIICGPCFNIMTDFHSIWSYFLIFDSLDMRPVSGKCYEPIFKKMSTLCVVLTRKIFVISDHNFPTCSIHDMCKIVTKLVYYNEIFQISCLWNGTLSVDCKCNSDTDAMHAPMKRRHYWHMTSAPCEPCLWCHR